MKKHISFLLFLVITLFTNAQDKQYQIVEQLKNDGFVIHQIKHVHTVYDFFRALDSNTIIMLEPGTYEF